MAQKTIQTSIIIKSTPEKVWQVLTDFESYPKWNPFVKSLTGEMVVGQYIAIQLDGMSFKPQLLVYDEKKELRWKGKLLMKGLFDGEHTFVIEPNGDDSVTFHHAEEFNGLLVALFSKNLDKKTKPGFEAMNRALKKQVEG